jgi:hypothetical protein
MEDKLKKIGQIVAGMALVSALGACSTLQDEISTEKHYTTDSKKPLWVDNPADWSKKNPGYRWFQGTATGVDDESLARQDAKISAFAQISDQIRDTVHNYFNSARTLDSAHAGDYSVETEKAIESGTLSVSRAVISGAKVDRFWRRLYWQRWAPGAPREYSRDEYCLVSMSDRAYEKTLYDTLNTVRKEVQDPKAQHVLDFMRRHYLNDLNGHK